MTAAHFTSIPTLAEATGWTPGQIVELAQAYASVKQQPAWFKRQLFDPKSEKRPVEANPAQMSLGRLPIAEVVPPEPAKVIAAHTRRARRTDCAAGGDAPELFFDASWVQVETINVPIPEIVGLTPAQCEVTGRRSVTVWRNARAATSFSSTSAR